MINISLFTASCLICASVIAAGAANITWLKIYFSLSSYYFIALLVFTWVIVLLKCLYHHNRSIAAFIKKNHITVIWCLLITAVVFISVPHYYRVLSDETNLLSVARTMTFEKQVDNITEGTFYYDRFNPTERSVEKRLFVFPFFIHLLHVIFGYHSTNVFVLNFLALWGFLTALVVLLLPIVGRLWAFAALFLVIAQPIVTLNATSGSYEIFNALFIILSFLGLRFFLNNPSRQSFYALVFTLLILANIRYESLIFAVVILGLLLVNKLIKKDYLTQSQVLMVAPFTLLPFIIQRLIMTQLTDSNLIGGSWVNSFSINNVLINARLFITYILDISGVVGYAGLVNWLALLALVFFIIQVLFFNKRKMSLINKTLLSIIAVSILTQFIIVVSYQGGINDHPLNGRLYILTLITFSLLPLLALHQLCKQIQHAGKYALVLSLAVFMYYHPVAIEDTLSNDLLIVREDRWVREFLANNADKNTLLICGRPGQYIVDNRGAISFNSANTQKDIILEQLGNGLFSKIYVIQDMDYATKTPQADNVVDSAYVLEPIVKTQISGEYYRQISLVKQ